MIHPKELRIGNFVNGPGGILTIVEIGQCGIITRVYREVLDMDLPKIGVNNVVDRKEGFEFYQLSGVPISEEVLDKCGFSFSPYLSYRGVRLSISYQLFDPHEGWLHLDSPFGVSVIKSLHHLQNWFFALTGKELELKNKI